MTTSEAPLATAVEAVPAPSSTAEAGIVALHEFDVDVPLIEIAFRNGAPDALRSFHVPLSPHRTVEVDVVRFDQLADEEGVFSGSIRGYADSQAVFSYVGLAYAGTVVLAAEQRAYYITATETGQMRITELDLMNAPGCAQPLIAQSDVP